MEHIVKEDLPLLEILALMAPDSSKSTLRSWLKEGRITVDDVVVKIAATPISKGQKVSIGAKKKFAPGEITILYDDDYLTIIDKPEGLLSVSTETETVKTAYAYLKNYYYPRKVFVIHRLDQGTSGVMVFALQEEVAEKLKEIFEKHDIERRYRAIVEGHVRPKEGTWESYLYEDANYVVHSTKNTAIGKLAITHYKVIAESKKHSLLDLQLETGRKNQIRVQCQDANHPVHGDKKYGAKDNVIYRLCLHAYLLAFKHPVTQKQLSFSSPIPAAFDKIVKQKK